jgi:hypothetical protein
VGHCEAVSVRVHKAGPGDREAIERLCKGALASILSHDLEILDTVLKVSVTSLEFAAKKTLGAFCRYPVLHVSLMKSHRTRHTTNDAT